MHISISIYIYTYIYIYICIYISLRWPPVRYIFAYKI